VFPWGDIPLAHMKMMKNQHPPGNMSVMVSAPRAGLKTLEDSLEAVGG
jgi:crotonyl-CoA carboxylase/reductase